MTEPFRFAVQAAPAENWPELAREVEALGYHALLLPDHQGRGGVLTGMAIAGAVTTSLVVGSLVLAVDFRQPVVLAQELATLDVALGGRLEIGLGAGWMTRDYRRVGVPMTGARERIDRLAEFVAAFCAVWDGTGTYSGRYYRFEDAVLEPRPGGPRPRLVLGGGGTRMLNLAARLADIVNLGASMSAGRRDAVLGDSAGIAAFDRRAELVRSQDRPMLVQCLAYETKVTEDAVGYADRHVCASFGMAPVDVLASPLALLGTVEEICDRLVAHRDRLGISYWVVKRAAMREFAPVVARLSGR